MATPRRDGMTSTAVTGILYGYGIQASRDRIARLSNLIFGAELRRAGTQRRFSDAQVELLAEAYRAIDDADIDLTVVERAVGDRPGPPLHRFRAVLGEITRRRADAVARFTALTASEDRMTA